MQGITTKFHFQRQKDQIDDITMGDRLCVDVGAVDKDYNISCYVIVSFLKQKFWVIFCLCS